MDSSSHKTQNHHVSRQMSPGLVAESATNHARRTGVERNDNEEAIEQSPRRRDVFPHQGNCHISTDDSSDCRSGRGNIGPKTVLSRGRLVGRGEVIA